MIDHPFLSFKDLSDDELLEKTSELHRALGRANMWGSSNEITNQLLWMLEMIQEEKMERLKKQNFEAMQNMFPPTVESDPDFKVEKKAEETAGKKSQKPKAENRSFEAPIFHKEILKDPKPK